ncbi:SNF2 helicase associated domain-containing protein [Alteribacter keqinensis]|uniref:Helicase SNF2 n=1 Tax=Alteribacter keqinensis TaxID=2483800 RepID=A0A3M7TMQ1_9BACI|nr:SNF2 helicase associated domain-containing protein [Alteribacter keqinensis]RNA66815.1 helicase SNF2 [Alteribacter keqinensis]
MFRGLTEDRIKDASSSATVFSRGRRYFEDGAVEDLSFSSVAEVYEATVIGMDDYDVMVDVNNGNIDIASARCTCQAFDTYPGLCKHLSAFLLQILHEAGKNKRGRLTPVTGATVGRKDHAKSLIESFNQVYDRKKESFSEKEQLQVEFTLNLTSSWGTYSGAIDLEMKIGPKRRYVVKDIKEFLFAMEQSDAVRFSKLFTYHPSDYSFKDEDLRVFRQLSRIFHVEEEILSFGYRNSGLNDDKRRMQIPNSFLKDTLEALKVCDVKVETNMGAGDHFTGLDVEYNPEKLPLHFTLQYLDEERQQYQLRFTSKEKLMVIGEKYNVAFFDGTFYFITDEEKRTLLTIDRQFADIEEVTVPKEQMMDFSSVVLPQLMAVGTVDVAPDVKQLIKAEPLTGKLYVDMVDDMATARLEFVYGDMTLSPFDLEQPDSEEIVVRDVEKEMLLLSQIESLPFKYNGKELYLEVWEDVLDFLLVELPVLSEMMEVYTTSEVQRFIHTPVDDPKIHVEKNERMNLLDITFQFEGIEGGEIEAMLTALAENRKYYKLSNGAYMNLQDERFANMKQVLEQMPTPMDGYARQSQVPLMQAFLLDEAGAESIKRGKRFRELLERIYHPEEVDTTVPKTLNATMREYQKVGFGWLKTLGTYGFGGILADDMGLGKTIQTIAYLLSEKADGKEGQALIVCPSSLVYNWQKEIQRFAPSLSTAVISGPSAERLSLLEGAKEADVVITSYPLLRRDTEHYIKTVFSVFILDEAQYVKNDWTQTARAVKAIRASQAFALSGTPIENSLDELYSIFEVVLPGLFRSKKAFKEMKETDVAKRVRPFVLRRVKEDVLSDLPDKIENVQFTELSDSQKAVYLAQLQMLKNEVKTAIREDSFQENRMKILAGLTRLRQICCHPKLFMENYTGNSGKLDRLMEYLKEAVPSGKRVVIFSQFTKMLAMIRLELEKHGWKYHYLDGKTPSSDRVAMTEEYNAGGKPLFLISLKAGGTGLNLTGGDTVILFDSWWNPAVEEQAADRVHRFGQKKVVQVVKLVTAGTIEEKIHQLQDQKRELMDKVIQTGETSITSLNKDDIQELLQV